MARKYRIKSYTSDSHYIQRRWCGLWFDMDTRWATLDNAFTALAAHVRRTHGYPTHSRIITEEEIING